jgi:uncharacterized protein (UPF0335 family)
MSDDYNDDEMPSGIDVSGMDADNVRGLYKRMRDIEERKAELGDELKDLKTDFKNRGLDSKTIGAVAKVVKIEMKNRDKLKLEKAIVQEVAEICRVEIP